MDLTGKIENCYRESELVLWMKILSMSHGATILRYKFNKCDHKKPIQNTLRAYINPQLRKGKGAGERRGWGCSVPDSRTS